MVKYRSLEHTIIGTMLSEKFPDKKKKTSSVKDAPQDDNKDPAQEDQGSAQPKKDAGPPQPNGQQQPIVKAPPVKKVKDPQGEKMDAGDEPVKLGQGNAIDLKPELETPDQRDKPVQEGRIPSGQWTCKGCGASQIRKEKHVSHESCSKCGYYAIQPEKKTGKHIKKPVKEGINISKWWIKSNPVRNVDKSQEQHLETMKKHARIAKGYDDQANNPPMGLKPAQHRMHVDSNKRMADMHHRQAGSSLGWYLKNDSSKEGAMKAYKALREDCEMSEECIDELYGKGSLPKIQKSLEKRADKVWDRHHKSGYAERGSANGPIADTARSIDNRATDARLLQKKVKKEETDMTALQNVKTILEARHRAGGGAKGVGRTVKDGYGKTMQVNSKGQDTEGDDHIINQLRKASNLRDHSITFKNKEKAHVPSHHAKKALEIYSGLKTSQEKSHMASRMHSSHSAFKDALTGKVAPPAGKKKITLPTTPFDWRK